AAGGDPEDHHALGVTVPLEDLVGDACQRTRDVGGIHDDAHVDLLPRLTGRWLKDGSRVTLSTADGRRPTGSGLRRQASQAWGPASPESRRRQVRGSLRALRNRRDLPSTGSGNRSSAARSWSGAEKSSIDTSRIVG